MCENYLKLSRTVKVSFIPAKGQCGSRFECEPYSMT